MSGYEYAYKVSPARPSGWRSMLAGFVTIVTVVAVSGISGAVVTLELIAPKSPRADAAPTTAAESNETTGSTEHTASIAAPSVAAPSVAAPSVAAPSVVTPRVVMPSVQPVAQDGKQDQTPRIAAAPVAAPAARATVGAAQQAIASARAGKGARAVPDGDLTFAKGYAQRRAAQEEAATHSPESKVAAVSQLGRAAVPRKPAYARSTVSPDGRSMARGEATGYYDRPGGFDFRRHEALAYGEELHRRPEPQGFFGGLFRNNNY